MSSCPICYEAYSEFGGDTVPHKLSCGDILCCSCIRSELFDGEFYCPECSTALKGSIIEEFSTAMTLSELVPKYTSDDGTSDDEHSTSSRSNSTESSPRGDNRVVNFASGKRTLSIRTPCKDPNCDKKAFGNGYCLKHSKRLSKSVLGLEQIAIDMLEHHDLRNFTASSRSLHKSDQQRARSTVIFDPPALLAKFKAQERLELGETLELIMRAKAVMSREPNILRLDAPVIVVGDIHGQFFDLANVMHEATKSTGAAGKADLSGPTYLFLGDYVDRGHYSCEVMLYLLSLKVANPEKVWLVRGNHECASVSGHFGFKQECKMKYGVNIYYSFLLMFQTMPLGAIIATAFGDIYACHGGLSPGLTTIDEIESIDRMVEPESNPSLMDILWADPISDENVENMTPEEYSEFIDIDWRPNPARGCSYCYGYLAVKSFLQKNALVCLVRAHEVQEEGYRKHFAPEIMEAKIVTLQQKLDRAALARAAATAAVHKHSNRTSRASSFVDGDLGELGELGDAGELSDTHSEHSVTDLCTPQSDVAEPSTSRPQSERVLSHNSSSFDLFHNKRSSPYRPDTSSTASIEQPEDFPPVITIFSAPNYCDRYQNKGAILLIDSALDGFRVIQYDCVEHPKPEIVESQTKTLIDLVISTCPYMPTSFRNFVQLAVELGEDLEIDSESDSDSVVAGGDGEDSVTSLEGEAVIIGSPKGLPKTSTASADSEPTDGATAGIAGTVDINAPPNDGGAAATALPTPPTPRLQRRASKTISLIRQSSISSITSPGFDRSDSPNAPLIGLESFNSGGSILSLSPVMEGALGGANGIDGNITAIDEDLEYHSPSLHMIPLVVHPHPQSARDRDISQQDSSVKDTSVETSTNNNIMSNADARLPRKKSNVYIQALASDSINEVHPQRLNLYLEQFKKTLYEASSKKGLQMSLFELSGDEKPAISVNDLKNRFERRLHSDSFTTNAKPFTTPKEVVHDFERGTGISNIMNMFGGSGRLTNFPKTRTSFPFPLPTENRFGADTVKDSRMYHSECSTPVHNHHSEALHTPSDDQQNGTNGKDHHGGVSPGRLDSTFGHTHTDNTQTPSSADNTETATAVQQQLSGTNGDGVGKQLDSVLFSQSEIMGLRLMFSLFDRSGSNKIAYEDLVAYAEETDDAVGIRNAGSALEILDLDGDGFIGLLDFIYFARRLKKMHQTASSEQDVV